MRAGLTPDSKGDSTWGTWCFFVRWEKIWQNMPDGGCTMRPVECDITRYSQDRTLGSQAESATTDDARYGDSS